MSVPTTPDEPRPTNDDLTTGGAPDPVEGTAPQAPPAPDEVEDEGTDVGVDRGAVPPFPPAPGGVSGTGTAGVAVPAGDSAGPLGDTADDDERR